ncbi:hypothetical protein SAMN04490244_105348 [Tranquillimonas rosea]|uniref:Uncharacterized protein n=1 Tax=Tranquillimonas rosea TaxID=641238 RepID=A0A1H9UKK5_9RHOB|nr:hypothetical protein [Tranquillimonas rosea]SES09892.1 hypothetical protein SAMN04490244_105348 [Tranquillimonas rosea]
MHRHILDKNRPSDSVRHARYLDLERRLRMHGPHRAIDILRRQPKERGPGRAKAYMAIERFA